MLKRNRDNSVILEVAPKHYISNSFVEYEGYSISSRIFLPTVVDIWSSGLNFPIPVHFSSLIIKVLTILHLLLDHFQFTLIHGPNIPGSYAILFFTASDFTLATKHINSCASFLLWPSHFIHAEVIALYSSPVTYCAPSNLTGSCSGII